MGILEKAGRWMIENARANGRETEVRTAVDLMAAADYFTPLAALAGAGKRALTGGGKGWTFFVEDPNTAKKRLKDAGIKTTLVEHAGNAEGRPGYFFSVDREDAEQAALLIDDCGIDPISQWRPVDFTVG